MKYFFIFLGLFFSIVSQASVTVNATRVIYPSDVNFVSVQLINRASTTHLVQSWIDDGDVNNSPEKIKVPFILTPPVIKMKGNEGQMLKVIGRGTDTLPQDRESVFWLNVVDIPPQPERKTGDNYLQVAIRSRIKLFYRPAMLSINAKDAMEYVSLQQDGGRLCMKNNSPYYITIINMVPWKGGDLKVKIAGNMLTNALFISPFSCLSVPEKVSADNKYRVTYLDDFGAQRLALL